MSQVDPRTLCRVFDAVLRWRTEHPAERVLRVGIDGVDGAGKTTLADTLAPLIGDALAPPARAVRASIDDFHRPRADRYRLGRDSPEGYYQDAFDIDTARRVLLDPLGAAGNHQVPLAAFAHRTDRALHPMPVPVPPAAS
jgi:uridine kinase